MQLKLCRWPIAGTAVLLCTLCSVAGAGVISYSAPLTDDASTGISPAVTYTHAISGGTAATVNGVSLAVLDAANTPANFDWNTDGKNKNVIACCNNGDWVPANGGVTGADLTTLLGSFTYSGNGDASPSHQTFTLSGLTPGQAYDARLFVRSWDTEGSGRPIAVTFTNGSEVDTIASLMEDRPAEVLGGGTNHSAYYIGYQYTAQGSELAIDTMVTGGAGSGSFHMYALTNAVVPEPSSLVLASLALAGVIALCRRKAV